MMTMKDQFINLYLHTLKETEQVPCWPYVLTHFTTCWGVANSVDPDPAGWVANNVDQGSGKPEK